VLNADRPIVDVRPMHQLVIPILSGSFLGVGLCVTILIFNLDVTCIY